MRLRKGRTKILKRGLIEIAITGKIDNINLKVILKRRFFEKRAYIN